MKPFPSIDQFRQVVKEVRLRHDYKGKDDKDSPIYRHDSPYPRIVFTGTVKLHGTNAGIVKYKDRIEFQSRERVLTLQQDNSGFMLAMMNKNLDFLFEGVEFNEYVAVYGEWCGQGIQKGVAISTLPKMFVIFALNVDGEWIPLTQSVDSNDPDIIIGNKQDIYAINQFPIYTLVIDFEYPEHAQNKLIEVTEQVEKECPVGKYFGVSGIGEGVVWTGKGDKTYMFKVKGEKHSVSKVKTLASVDVEMVNNINEFVDNVVTEQRLNQGISWLKENGKSVDQKSTGDYLRWIVNDVIKEETDTIVANQLDPKKINSAVSNKARVWFFNYLNQKEFAN